MKSQSLFLTTLLPGLFALASAVMAQAEEPAGRPNILWIVSEDNSASWLGCYGNETADTPNLDKLATEGSRYTRCFADAPVCAPQRSTWITGMASISLGTHPMRSSYAVPDFIPVYPQSLQDAGYYTHNAQKTDYNGINVGNAWDSQGNDPAPWRKATADQPWFCIINLGVSHESGAFSGIQNTKHDPAAMDLADYHPHDETIRRNYARYADRITLMDEQVGEALAALEADGLAENTIVIYNSDHGGVLPRSKRYLHGSGLHCPLIIRVPEKFAKYQPGSPGEPVEEIVSFKDLPTTMLKLAGAEIPDLMQGRVFLGQERDKPREWHFAFRERMDERYDNARAVHDGRYLYIRNYAPFAPWMQRLAYLWKMPATNAWEQLHQQGKTTEITGRWFEPKSVPEEL
ncbi:MAG: sulfatase [Verrucomicrobiota bacterium]